MNRFVSTLAPTLVILGIFSVASSQAQEAGKRVGEKLDDVGREIRGGANRAGQGLKEEFASVKISVQNMGIESRVYSRLHWDKTLSDATIELTATQDGTIILNGSVATTKAKTRAAELAEETVGVTKVIDKLAVRPATTTRP